LLILSVFSFLLQRQILEKLAWLANIRYSKEDPAHVAMLKQLWATWTNEKPWPGDAGPIWKTLGFQGEDPSTDFRGSFLPVVDGGVHA
jgi:ELMO/CED-12 family